MNYIYRKRFKNRFSTTSKSGIVKKYAEYFNNFDFKERSYVEKIVLLFLSLFTTVLIFLTIFAAGLSIFLPSVKNAEKLLNIESTIFYDRNGIVLYTVHGEQNRQVVKSEEIPTVIKQSAVAIEDDRFYKHRGFDIPGIIKAALSELGLGRRRGGSTITQQFVKNSFLSRERTYMRKFKEIILAVKIEKYYSKDEILTMYLNKIPYGGTAYGVQKASEVFFNKNVQELTLTEAIILASLPQAPTYYSPFGNNKYSTLNKEFTAEELAKRKIKSIRDLESTESNFGLIGRFYQLADGTNLYLPGRTDEVLRKMVSLKLISKEESSRALSELHNFEFNNYVASIKAPHFVFYVKELLEKKYGKELVENGGLRVHTTLDYEIYEEIRKMTVAQAQSNLKFNSKNLASITTKPDTGEIISMVGSIDYNNQDIDGSVNMATANRQPGSAYKPIVYAGALSRNSGAGTVLYDVPIRLDSDTPKNYDGTFRGPMSIRTALAQSRNIPAIKAYYLAGEQSEIITLSEKMGITTLDKRVDYGWPLGLGSGEVKMTGMTEAFGVFANGGSRIELNPILKITSNNGKVLEDNSAVVPKKIKVLEAPVAFIINNILSDRSVNLGGALNLPDGRVSAIKTGTSTKKVGDTSFPSNLWAVGYTPQFVTAVWAGNSNGEEMKLGADGYNSAVPLWNKIMTLVHKTSPKVNFERPEGVVSVNVSKLSGKLPGVSTPAHMIFADLFTSQTTPKEIDNSFYKRTVDTRNNKRPNAFCPSEFVKEVNFYNPQSEISGTRFRWQAEIIEWFETLEPEKLAELNLGESVVIGVPVDEDSELCDPTLANMFLDITILNLYDGDVVERGPFEVKVSPEAEAGVLRIEYYINDLIKSTKESAPFDTTLRVPVGFRPGREFNLKVKVVDINGFSKSKTIKLITGETDVPALEWEEMTDAEE